MQACIVSFLILIPWYHGIKIATQQSVVLFVSCIANAVRLV